MSALVLMYHRVSDREVAVDEGDYRLCPLLFARQMEHLADARIPVVPLKSLADGPAPEGAVVLTFDDGCDSDAEVVLPLLRRLGFPASFFINPARLGRPGFLTNGQLATLAQDDTEVGSHGLDHTLLDGLDESDLRRQLVGSKQALEQSLGREVVSVSLPGGTGGRRAVEMAHAAGYRFVLGSRPDHVGPPPLPRALPRVAVRRGDGIEGFRAMVARRPGALLGPILRFRLTRLGRRVLGVGGYARLRSAWVSRSDRGGPA